MTQPTLFDLTAPQADPDPPDRAARDFAVDPANDVVLEASAGTGKTRVLVLRYVRLIEAGVDPRHILAITFTRKAAAEMRERVLAELRRRAEQGAIREQAWRQLRDRVADIQISTIDAFCFALLREFPLEADVDPAFEIADETEMARFANEALDLTFRAARRLIVEDEAVRLLFARLKTPVLRESLRELLDRRQIALPAVGAFVARAATCRDAAEAAARFTRRLHDLVGGSPHRSAILDDGPVAVPEFEALRQALSDPGSHPGDDPAYAQQLRGRLQGYFLTKDGKPRQRLSKPFDLQAFASAGAKKRHESALKGFSPEIVRVLDAFDADVHGLLARGLQRLLVIAVRMYEALLEEHALLDFAGMLARAVGLLERQEEFARSRLKLQARYHHVLVDEFQDTSRLQWRLVELLVDAWGEGEGAADAPTSIFVVGDRKQSIYRFRHAEVTLLDRAAGKIAGLRPGRPVRQSISASFRSVPELLAFVNALASSLVGEREIPERFTFRDADRFPVAGIAPGARRDGEPVLGLVAGQTMEACAEAVAAEIERLIGATTVRDRSGPPRPARADDIAILFRARTGHQFFEQALEARDIRSYVYKGLGFFDAPEVQDLQALLRCLARPESDLRAAELLRSRFVRLSDVALARLQPGFAAVLTSADFDGGAAGLDEIDRGLLERARDGFARWLALADVVPPGELIDLILRESAYIAELRGRRLEQARENIKKVRALVRRVENRGYATLGRLAEYFETLRAGDESNAIVAAAGAVNLMTIHAAKGLEFPIVFLVNLHVPGRGRPAGFSVIESGPDGAPEVAFGSSPATRLEEAREEEELRRLFYVAATRARDRLYLAAELDDHGTLRRRTARSLAGLLPGSLADLFGAAATTDQDAIRWTSPHGAFDFRVCRPGEPAAAAGVRNGRVVPPPEAIHLAPVRAPGRAIAGAAAGAAAALDPVDPRVEGAAGSDRLLGRLVHRLFERGLDASAGEDAVLALVPQLLRPDERVDAGPAEGLAGRVAAAYFALRANRELSALLQTGRCLYEVPFSFCPPDRPETLVRGVVDCLVLGPEGRATVLELKTGAPRPEHQRQLETYVQGLSAVLPGSVVTGRIVYP